MGVTIRASSTALEVIGRIIAGSREQIVAEWAKWVRHRTTIEKETSADLLERQMGLLVEILAERAGPLRRVSADLWLEASAWYGQVAADRGLATGEVVEELQHLREILIRHLSDVIADLPSRQSLAAILRINRFLDQGIAHAVVGYTDALVESLLNRRGIPVSATESPGGDVEARLKHLELQLGRIRSSRQDSL